MSLFLQISAALVLVTVCGLLIVVVARAGDEKGAAEAARRRRVTRYTPPRNARPNDFDRYGRSW